MILKKREKFMKKPKLRLGVGASGNARLVPHHFYFKSGEGFWLFNYIQKKDLRQFKCLTV
ncbi:MAG: hypothetical protein A2736_01805 [Candidatus Yanofskybacteria bacterium RIFCSPHIGHO2_01_FULL_41_27]|uniref:Uncharacterized protein n=2 Tax=Candidatus Yanofskyibacteriota TaxID=1752733 RepID=A0A1F8HW27_9BACT|nr:MAG: hypothetical protein A2736_01805 [Candidatus Yanofskybacteria bacterium RIFCSPHIGHO2_01_FULL_41_27]OGN21780.1 MAG: hypothetical protein A3B00_02905 [Candidatus Yanofskybacteria bacterium RIFCSPLOWO2_01_FULL_41_33]OGN41126.1 MAG: hypothetical protein A2606_00590 [Candidatus Yanofskybacteria bacterium RIFOXYD1_FULL_42_10]